VGAGGVGVLTNLTDGRVLRGKWLGVRDDRAHGDLGRDEIGPSGP
jgi:hypothetical protein